MISYNARKPPSDYDSGFLFRELQGVQRSFASIDDPGVVNLDDPAFAELVVGGEDWSPSLAAAAGGLVNTGGTIFVPPDKRRGLSKTVTVSSKYPINIISEMSTLIDPAVAGPGGAFFYPLNDFTSSPGVYTDMIEYKTPVGATRFQAGAGIVANLQCIDISNLSAGTNKGKRNYKVRSFLGLTDFSHGTAQNISGTYLNGSAIRLDCGVMTDIIRPRVRYCGALGRNALYFVPADPVYPIQSTVLWAPRVEQCYDDTYLTIGANSSNLKIKGGGFEGVPADADSMQRMIEELGSVTMIEGTHFGNASAWAVVLRLRSSCTGGFFSGHAAGSLQLGDACVATGNVLFDNPATYSVNMNGAGSTYSGNTHSVSGGITGTGDFWHLNTIGRNDGVLTERQGQVTVAAGVTTGVVTHGLPYTPNKEDITLSPAGDIGAARKFWFDTITATQFTVNTDVAPGGAGALFAWQARLPVAA